VEVTGEGRAERNEEEICERGDEFVVGDVAEFS